MTEETTATFLPPSASRSGKNAFYVYCPIVEHNAAYCSCLDRIQRIANREKGNNSLSECRTAMNQGRCKAKDMKQDEELKGQALYFVARDSIVTAGGSIPDASPREGTGRRPTRSRPEPAKSPQTTALLDGAGGNFADAINAAMKAQPAPITTARVAPTAARFDPTPMPRPSMVAGETPMQFARRMATIRNQEKP